MNIRAIGSPRIIMENPYSRMNYFGWPTVARLKNDRLAVVASAFRLNHICPFGKVAMSVSENDSETWSAPAVIIDTPLDDRDAGILPFGDSGLIVTSFNNTRQSQRDWANKDFVHEADHWVADRPSDKEFRLAYLDMVTDQQEEDLLGGTFRISHDNGVTFGPLHITPVHSPHGPIELANGTILWVGEVNSFWKKELPSKERILSYRLNPDTGEMIYLGSVPGIVNEKGEDLPSWEPYVAELPNGRLICHIRTQLFTTYQSISDDGGITWSQPTRVLPENGGAPVHLMHHSSGLLIASYAIRYVGTPRICLMFSTDGGETWDKDHVLLENHFGVDLGYPSTVELHDGTLLTVYYAHSGEKEPAVIWQQKWELLP